MSNECEKTANYLVNVDEFSLGSEVFNVCVDYNDGRADASIGEQAIKPDTYFEDFEFTSEECNSIAPWWIPASNFYYSSYTETCSWPQNPWVPPICWDRKTTRTDINVCVDYNDDCPTSGCVEQPIEGETPEGETPCDFGRNCIEKETLG